MLYPAKLQFKKYGTADPWADWSSYLSEAPSISKKVESDNEGEAGLIVFDNASVSLYYAEGNPVYTAFQEANLTSAIRYMFRISAPKSNGTYEVLFEGMADFSTIEWPEESRLINFEVVDKLSALALLPDAPYREKKNLTARIKQQYYEARSMFVLIAEPSGALVNGVIQLHPEGDEITTFLDLYTPVLNAGEYVSVFGEDEKEQLMLVISSRVEGKFNHVQFASRDNLQSKNYNLTQNPVLYYTDSPFGNTDINILGTDGSVTGFNGLKIAESIIKQQWSDTEVLTKPASFMEFLIPVTYDSQLQIYNPLNKSGLDALKMLADSMFCYIYFNRDGKLVLQKKDSLGINGTTRSLGSTRVLDATKKYFWDKLVDGVTVEAQGWLYENNEIVTGTGTVVKTLPGSTDYLEPENEISKAVLAETTEQSTEASLNTYAVSVASKYLSFYGTRHASWDCVYSLDDNTIMWDLLDNLTLLESCFFTKIDYDLDSRTISVELVSVAGYDYDVRQVRKTKSESSYYNTSSGGSSSSVVVGSGGYSGNPYLWDGGAIGLNAVNARQNLGLKNIANFGDGIIGNTEFNYLSGLTANIQTQINAKENVLVFSDPLVRTGNQISINTGVFSLGANSNGFTLSGTGKAVGGDIALAFPQRLDTGGTPQFERIGAGGPAHASFKMMVTGDQYITGFLWIDGDIYIGGNVNQINQVNLNVQDRTVTLNDSGDNTTAIGAGLIVEGASGSVLANLIYDGTNWTHSHDVNAASGKGYKVNGTTVIDSGRNFNGVAGTFTSQLAWNGTSKSDNAFSFYTGASAPQSGKFKSLQVSTTFSGTIPDNGILFGTDANLYRSAAGILKTDNNFIIGGDYLSSGAFLSGYFGMGFKFWRDTNGANGELDNLVIRNSLRTHIFQKDIVRASNGYLFISDASEIAAESSTADATKYIYCKENTFQYISQYGGDLLWYKDADDAGGTITGIKIQTSSAGSLVTLPNSSKQGYRFSYTIESGSGIFKAGGTIVRYGSKIPGRQGSIYFDASSASAPFMDIYDGVSSQTDFQSIDKLVYRSGNLSGITDPVMGALSGYGIYTRRGFFTEDVFIGGRSLGLVSGMTALFHFDDNLYDSISGIKPSYSGTFNETNYGLITAAGLTATKANGKFGGGVAVEEAATNMLTGDNSNLELGIGTWGVYYGITGVERSNSFAKFGSYCLKINGSGSAVGGIQNTNGGARWTVSPGTVYTVSGYALSPSSRLTRVWIREYNSSGTLIANTGPSQIAPLAWTRQSYTFTTTAATAFIIVDIYVYNLATGESVYWDGLQLEQKSYSTSFTEGSRAAGKLIYKDVINPSAYTVSVYAYIDLTKMGYYGRIIDIALDANNRLQLCRYDTTNNMQFAVIADGTVRINRTSFVLSNGWHKFTLSYANSQYYIGVDGAAAYPAEFLASAYGAASTWKLSFGTDYAGSSFSNCIYDEASIWNRGITEDEDRKIYYSNQPLQESPGMTYISGNKIRTGMMYSENYVAGVSGSMWNLNTGYLETNDGVFRGTIMANSGLIGGWNITERWINKTLAGVNGYLLKLDTMTTVGTTDYERPRLEIGWGDGANAVGYGGNYITLGASSYMQTTNGAFTTPSGGAWDVNNGCGGLSVNVNGENILFAGRRKLVDETYKSGAAIAGWNFDKGAFWTGAKGNDGAYTSSGMTIGSSGFISAPNTFISSSGVLYSKSGNIAGFAFDSGKLNVGTDFVLDAAGKKLYFNNKSAFASTNAGIFLGLDSSVYKFAIGDGAKYLKWDGANLIALGANITGSTITGGIIQTAVSGQRVVINSADNAVHFYNTNGYAGYIRGTSTTLSDYLEYYTPLSWHKFYGIVHTNNYFTCNISAAGDTLGFIPRYLGSYSSVPANSAISGGIHPGDTYYDTSVPGVRMFTQAGWKTITLT